MTNNANEIGLVSLGFVIKDRWKLVKKIGGGGFGEIYEAEDLHSGDHVAAKLESLSNTKQVLKMEVTVLRSLQSRKNFCRFYGCGRDVTNGFNYMIMSLQGRNLAELRRSLGKFSIATVIKLSGQILNAIKVIHEAGFLHRDIKPSNFAMGRTQASSRVVFMLDFGLARQYVLNHSVRTARASAGFRGTVRYASLNAHLNKELGRHDDLWSMFYMLVEFAYGSLPWRNIKSKHEVGNMKRNVTPEKLAASLPEEFLTFVDHLKGLVYEDCPDYRLIRDCIRGAAVRLGVKTSDLFDWERPQQPKTLLGKSAAQTGEAKARRPITTDTKAMATGEAEARQKQSAPMGLSTAPTDMDVASRLKSLTDARSGGATGAATSATSAKPVPLPHLLQSALDQTPAEPANPTNALNSPNRVKCRNQTPRLSQSMLSHSPAALPPSPTERKFSAEVSLGGVPARHRSASAARVHRSGGAGGMAVSNRSQEMLNYLGLNAHEVSTASYTHALAQNGPLSRLVSESTPMLNRLMSMGGASSVTQMAGLGLSSWDLNALDENGSFGPADGAPASGGGGGGGGGGDLDADSEKSDIDDAPPVGSRTPKHFHQPAEDASILRRTSSSNVVNGCVSSSNNMLSMHGSAVTPGRRPRQLNRRNSLNAGANELSAAAAAAAAVNRHGSWKLNMSSQPLPSHASARGTRGSTPKPAGPVVSERQQQQQKQVLTDWREQKLRRTAASEVSPTTTPAASGAERRVFFPRYSNAAASIGGEYDMEDSDVDAREAHVEAAAAASTRYVPALSKYYSAGPNSPSALAGNGVMRAGGGGGGEKEMRTLHQAMSQMALSQSAVDASPTTTTTTAAALANSNTNGKQTGANSIKTATSKGLDNSSLGKNCIFREDEMVFMPRPPEKPLSTVGRILEVRRRRYQPTSNRIASTILNGNGDRDESALSGSNKWFHSCASDEEAAA